MKVSEVEAIYLGVSKLRGGNIPTSHDQDNFLLQNSLIARMDDTLPRPYNGEWNNCCD